MKDQVRAIVLQFEVVFSIIVVIIIGFVEPNALASGDVINYVSTPITVSDLNYAQMSKFSLHQTLIISSKLHNTIGEDASLRYIRIYEIRDSDGITVHIA
ncbi:MAG: hypothetical protein ACREBU_15770, partial [Nitrososphaera sp.]